MSRQILALLSLALVAGPAAAQDGARIFQLQCKGCHADVSTPMGPTLRGVAGAKIAGRSDYAYSAGLKAKDGTWDAATLDAYLKAPTAFAPRSRMFQALTMPEDRSAVIAYLQTLK